MPAAATSQRHRRRRLVALAVGLALLVALSTAAFVATAGCGGKDDASAKSIREILGHEPTGVAKKVADDGSMTVGTDADYEPQSWIDPDTKELVGFDIDVAKHVGDDLRVKVEFVNPNWDDIVEGLKIDRFDTYIGSLPVTTARAKTMAFTKPYYYATAQVVVRKGEPKVDSADGLAGKTVGVAAQTSYQSYLQTREGVTVEVFATDADAVAALVAKKVDAVLMSDLSFGEAKSGGKAVEMSDKALFYEPMAFAVKPDEPDMLAMLNHAIDDLRDDGTLAGLSKDWYGGMDATKPPGGGVPTYEQALAK